MSKRKKNPSELVLMGANPGRRKNPSELLLMGANPMKGKHRNGQMYGIRWDRTHSVTGAYHTREEAEKVLRSFHGKGAVIGLNPMDIDTSRRRNPTAGIEPETPQAVSAVAIAEGFHGNGWEWMETIDEPHMRDGDYAQFGMLYMLTVKPTPSGKEYPYVQELFFWGRDIRALSDTARHPIYFAGGNAEMIEPEIKMLTTDRGDEVELGQVRIIDYVAAKYHPQVENRFRGKQERYGHPFGEKGGEKPTLVYSRSMKRLMLRGGTYRVEDAGIVN